MTFLGLAWIGAVYEASTTEEGTGLQPSTINREKMYPAKVLLQGIILDFKMVSVLIYPAYLSNLNKHVAHLL
ncbi:hypothetical protein CRP01_17090 [Flavilitoribacter nigricans DSM 23189 = NBRC 102662]|uniref:Uncharacterized protein n=1 Tax=Flavilitoribacter nigricans (strain ATCC 23147 / DSM 23189 / NBRC 102662 / NCIMB 1420 / SS-2) TaxID=1122177 RepID=A0A2D0N9N3_FLAN2|nr:hypothetical protein CRP01_17090 [Flavilitoribacter nigricans DSM 23189 = NBRC 102662]